ncbi:hypothetical protein HYS50_00690 [Candidatus Woesearchaeota archaeon]|nr:hypothetical protein [Candidatus Woesearchaeota archaeon]
MELRDKVLACVKSKGPVLPMQVAKDIQRDTFYAGAILSELAAEKIVKISTAKIGGSPVYYMPGQEEKLNLLYQGLPQKEKEAYNLLREKKMVKDRDVAPAIRVALRMIKDFAVPSYDKNQEIVWRWYLQKEHPPLIQQVQPKQPSFIPQTILQATAQQPQARRGEQTTILPKELQGVKKPAKREAPELFMQAVRSYIQNSHIQVIEEKMIKKNKELELIAKVPSNLGLLDYVLIAKNKKKIADSDLSLAHNQGQLKKMPVIFLTNGELSRKAHDYKEKNLKGFMLIKQL